MTGTWMARARRLVADQPPTLAGLDAAVRTAELASATLARSVDDQAATAAAGAALLCASAAGCLDVARPHKAGPGTDPDSLAGSIMMGTALDEAEAPDRLTSLDLLLRDCLDVAVAVLDNEDEPLTLHQVQEIGAAVGLLDRARAMCCEVVR